MLVHAGACTGRALTRVHVCDTRTGNILPLSWVRTCKTRTGQALPRVRVCDVYTGHTLPLSCVCTCGARTGHALPYQPCSFLRDTTCLSAVFVHAEHTQATHCPVFVHVKTCTGHVLPHGCVRACETCAGHALTVVVHAVHAQATSCLSVMFVHAKHTQAILGLSAVSTQARLQAHAGYTLTTGCVRTCEACTGHALPCVRM